MDTDRIKGTLLGTAVGDALGMPVEGLSHAQMRSYYWAIKEYRADEVRGDLAAGQWTDDTQLTFALARAFVEAGGIEQLPEAAARAYVALLPEARRWGETTRVAVRRLRNGTTEPEATRAARPTVGAAMRAAPLGAWWAVTDAPRDEAFEALRAVFEVTHRHEEAVAAGFGQAFAVHEALKTLPAHFDPTAFWTGLIEMTAWAEERLGAIGRLSGRLEHLTDAITRRAVPLDLLEQCDGAGILAREAWPFAVAMFARAPHLIDATLLSTINAGGDADTTGAMTGALLGALHGWMAFPSEWKEGLEAVEQLEVDVDLFVEALA